ncbi:MAG: hypothetical protein IJX72_03960, partial [Clostridia bacterium]|nr:hypothetical protein [Clostridia bacterium]
MLKYEIKKLLGNKFILFFFVLLFFINGVLTYYGIPRAGEGGRLYKEDWQNRAATFEVYNADPESFVEEMKISYAYYKKHTEVSSKMVSDMMIT